MKSKNRSWIQQHVKDPYVLQSQRDGYRSRASYKLLEIVEKNRLIRPGMTVVDLGSTPGGWSQVAARMVGHEGRVHALDILPMDELADVTFIQGDFSQPEALKALENSLEGRLVDVVLSDMAPNMSGQKAVDQPKSMYLVELALEFARENLRVGGCFLTKVFHSEGFEQYYKELRQHFEKVISIKPKASRDRSTEVYVLARGKL